MLNTDAESSVFVYFWLKSTSCVYYELQLDAFKTYMIIWYSLDFLIELIGLDLKIDLQLWTNQYGHKIRFEPTQIWFELEWIRCSVINSNLT